MLQLGFDPLDNVSHLRAPSPIPNIGSAGPELEPRELSNSREDSLLNQLRICGKCLFATDRICTGEDHGQARG